jgi:Polyketide cyclase / dehydrase and lipid transport
MKALIENEIDIERPAEEVFDYVSDHLHEQEWNPRMRRVRKLTEGPIGLGTRYEMEFIPGRPLVATCDGFDRPRSWQVTGKALGMDVTLGGHVTPKAAGSHLVFRTEFRSRGLRSFVLPLVQRRMAAQMQHHVERIKSILEMSSP